MTILEQLTLQAVAGMFIGLMTARITRQGLLILQMSKKSLDLNVLWAVSVFVVAMITATWLFIYIISRTHVLTLLVSAFLAMCIPTLMPAFQATRRAKTSLEASPDRQ